MSYELEEIKYKLSPENLKVEFRKFHDVKILKGSIWEHQVKEPQDVRRAIKDQAYSIITYDFKSFFSSELLRIITSISNRRIDYDDEKFNRYLHTNYKEILKLHDPSQVIAPNHACIQANDFMEKYDEYTTEQIYSDLQTELAIPLKKYIDETYRELLVDLKLLESPIDSFLSALANYKIRIELYYEPSSLEYSSHYVASNQSANVYYNGFCKTNLYNNHLKHIYNNFKEYVTVALLNFQSVGKKAEYLEDIIVEIKEITGLFKVHANDIHLRASEWRVYRRDAIDEYENAFNELGIEYIELNYTDFYRLIGLQKQFANQAYEFINSKIKLVNKQLEIESFQKDLAENPNNNNIEKIKTNLSVHDLAFLFKCLVEKDIINAPKGEQAALFRTLSKTFSSKRQENISNASLKNKYDIPDQKAVQYVWQLFGELKQIAAKYK